jgi:hypothetical protein
VQVTDSVRAHGICDPLVPRSKPRLGLPARRAYRSAHISLTVHDNALGREKALRTTGTSLDRTTVAPCTEVVDPAPVLGTPFCDSLHELFSHSLCVMAPPCASVGSVVACAVQQHTNMPL